MCRKNNKFEVEVQTWEESILCKRKELNFQNGRKAICHWLIYYGETRMLQDTSVLMGNLVHKTYKIG